MSEKEQYGSIKSAEPIPVQPQGGTYVVSTPNATAMPDPNVQKAVNETIAKDLLAQRQQRSDDGS